MKLMKENPNVSRTQGLDIVFSARHVSTMVLAQREADASILFRIVFIIFKRWQGVTNCVCRGSSKLGSMIGADVRSRTHGWPEMSREACGQGRGLWPTDYRSIGCAEFPHLGSLLSSYEPVKSDDKDALAREHVATLLHFTQPGLMHNTCFCGSTT